MCDRIYFTFHVFLHSSIPIAWHLDWIGLDCIRLSWCSLAPSVCEWVCSPCLTVGSKCCAHIYGHRIILFCKFERLGVCVFAASKSNTASHTHDSCSCPCITLIQDLEHRTFNSIQWPSSAANSHRTYLFAWANYNSQHSLARMHSILVLATAWFTILLRVINERDRILQNHFERRKNNNN